MFNLAHDFWVFEFNLAYDPWGFEAEIPTEYVNRLRSKDQRYHHTQPGHKGPMEAALQSYGGCN